MAAGLLEGRHLTITGPVNAIAFGFYLGLLLCIGILVYQGVKLRYRQNVRWWLVVSALGIGWLLGVLLSTDPMHRIGFIYVHAALSLWSIVGSMLAVGTVAAMISIAVCQERLRRATRSRPKP